MGCCIQVIRVTSLLAMHSCISIKPNKPRKLNINICLAIYVWEENITPIQMTLSSLDQQNARICYEGENHECFYKVLGTNCLFLFNAVQLVTIVSHQTTL
ncbi:hypothetical protein PRUPE_8G020200 [Prunus persica]|uniref:Uncharacterized protein n=1 Tax=Prunus persica TaxID=3760 RepID=M5W1J6_PRUPE|nr:hypothetical protein PRUPE_8G020200 [Prunus persica]